MVCAEYALEARAQTTPMTRYRLSVCSIDPPGRNRQGLKE